MGIYGEKRDKEWPNFTWKSVSCQYVASTFGKTKYLKDFFTLK